MNYFPYNKTSRATLFFSSLILLLSGVILSAQNSAEDADSLLARLDANQLYTSGHSVGTITITDRFGTKVSGFESFSLGDDKSYIRFTSGEEKGQKILRLGDTIYVAYPEADKPVKIQGAALRDSVAGSDFSYEDMNGERSLTTRYKPTITGSEDLDGQPCTVLELNAKKPGIPYPYVKMWVSKATNTALKSEEYSQNKRLLKTQLVLATKQVGKRTVAVKIQMTDHLKGKSATSFELSQIEIDAPVSKKLFSLEELTW